MELDIDSMDREDVLTYLREVLQRRQAALSKALQGDLSELQAFNNNVSGDLLDCALDSEQYEINSQLVSVQSRELAKTEAALRRMRQGSYGQCESCAEEIAVPRLAALPYTTVCIDCARAAESEHHGSHPHSNWDRVREQDTEDSISLSDYDYS